MPHLSIRRTEVVYEQASFFPPLNLFSYIFEGVGRECGGKLLDQQPLPSHQYLFL